jgi:hypothetical protein
LDWALYVLSYVFLLSLMPVSRIAQAVSSAN